MTPQTDQASPQLARPDASSLVFFLGGYDLEMVTIRDLLQGLAPGRCHDRHLGWGAKTSDYGTEIPAALSAGLMPVLVELTDDLHLDPAAVIVIDHHGPRAAADGPTSLHQVFDLLGAAPGLWTRQMEFVAANDRGYIPALLEAGATPAEIAATRAADRAAQGITPDEEAEAARAVAAAVKLAGGRLTVARLAHCRTSAVTDLLEPALGGTGYVNLLVLCPEEANFYGTGDLVLALNRQFPGGWYGGSLPARGFWGRRLPAAGLLPWLVEQTA